MKKSASGDPVIIRSRSPSKAPPVIGLLGSMVTSRLLQTQLVGVEPLDPAALGGTVVLLLLVTVAATLIPARRATRVDPLVALRDG